MVNNLLAQRLEIQPFLAYLGPANCVEDGGNALRPDAPHTLELAGCRSPPQPSRIEVAQVLMDARSNRWPQAAHIHL